MTDTPYRPTTSESIASLATALAKAQGKFTNPQKDRDNPFFKSKYATLDALIDCTRAVLSENELSIVQIIRSDARMELITRLMHSSGEWIESNIPLMTIKEGAQKLGSEITYMRRYSYAAILSITADEDDDGNDAQSAQPAAKKQPPSRPAPAQQTAPPPRDERPREIKIPLTADGKDDWARLADRVMETLKSATTREDCERWIELSLDAIEECQEKAPKVYANIARAIAATRERLPEAAGEPDFIGPDETAGALKP